MIDKEIICSFFGHRNIGRQIKPLLYDEIDRHITEKGVNTFYVGGYGDFDRMAAGVLREIKARYPHIRVYHILAYLPTGSGDYSNTIFPEGLELVPRRFAITHRNRWIAEQSDYVIAYVQTSYGGAYVAVKYAKGKNKSIVNLAQSKYSS